MDARKLHLLEDECPNQRTRCQAIARALALGVAVSADVVQASGPLANRALCQTLASKSLYEFAVDATVKSRGGAARAQRMALLTDRVGCGGVVGGTCGHARQSQGGVLNLQTSKRCVLR